MTPAAAITAFNSTLLRFLVELDRKYPAAALGSGIISLQTALNLFPDSIPTGFRDLIVAPCRHALINKDAATLLSHIQNDAMLGKLSDVWPILTDADKDTTWRYMQILLQLCDTITPQT
jgi:hypothetical protein